MSRHVLEQLPLWVEGDLSSAEHANVEAHLAECPACRETAQQLRSSQHWLRDAMASPFEAADQDRLRLKVMEQIRAEAAPRPIRRLALRPSLLAVCAATLLMATFTWPHAKRLAPPTLSPLPTVITPLPAIPQPLPTQAQADPLRMARAHTPPHTARQAPSPPHEEPVRIELQTADPTVRIIWLAQVKPLPEPTTSLSEAP